MAVIYDNFVVVWLAVIYDNSVDNFIVWSDCSYVMGIILREKLPAFELMLKRATYGIVYICQAEISEPLEDSATVSTYLKDKRIYYSTYSIT